MAKKWGLFLSILLISCGSIRKDAHIAVYKRDWLGEIPPEYLILRFDDQIYDTYHGAGGQIGEVGKFTIKDDTLFCAQRREIACSKLQIMPSLILSMGFTQKKTVHITNEYYENQNCIYSHNHYFIMRLRQTPGISGCL